MLRGRLLTESLRVGTDLRITSLRVVRVGRHDVSDSTSAGQPGIWTFDPEARLIFFSCGDGTLSIFHEKSADEIEDAGAVKTQQSAKTMAFDPKTKKVYLPAAEYTEVPATEPGKRPTRTMKPDSFLLLVLGK